MGEVTGLLTPSPGCLAWPSLLRGWLWADFRLVGGMTTARASPGCERRIHTQRIFPVIDHAGKLGVSPRWIGGRHLFRWSFCVGSWVRWGCVTLRRLAHLMPLPLALRACVTVIRTPHLRGFVLALRWAFWRHELLQNFKVFRLPVMSLPHVWQVHRVTFFLRL